METDLLLSACHEAGHAIFAYLLYGPNSISYIGKEDGNAFCAYSNGDSAFESGKYLYTIHVAVAGMVAEALFGSDVESLKAGCQGDLQTVINRLADTHFKHLQATPVTYFQTLETYIYDTVTEIAQTFSLPSVNGALNSVAELLGTLYTLNGYVAIKGESVHARIATFISKGEARKIKARFKPAYVTGLNEQKRREALNLHPPRDWLFNIVIKAANKNRA